ncbi:MAG: TetR family transcriptional regulator [Actinobacteria bacterium]|nr:TetR family transcriptional regulator [Actinomycetota bacterium]
MTRLPVGERRAQLIGAALAVATAEGIGAVTVRRVAEQAGVALGVVHYCFADKDELVAALASRIVDDLTAAGSAALAFDEPPTLTEALQVAVAGLWDTIAQTPDAQLLTYEITTHTLRHPELRDAARRQYEVSQGAAERLLTLAAGAAGARWSRPVGELAGEALAYVDGVTLRWLVDGDAAEARERLSSFAGYLATQATHPMGERT